MPAQEGTTMVLEVLWDLMLEVQGLDARLRDLEVTEGTHSRLAELSKQRNGALERIQQQHDVLLKQDLGPPFYTYFLKPKAAAMAIRASGVSQPRPESASASHVDASASQVF